jgi:hypothetical protein
MSGISPQQKKDPKKREKRSKDWKAKEVKPHLKGSMSPKIEKKKKEDEIYKLLGGILLKERKEITIL